MKRWDFAVMLAIGKKLFAKIYRRKQHCHNNHDADFMARDDSWLHEGVNALIAGSYDPEWQIRYYFEDGMVEQPRLNDRVIQHVLLKQLKPSFKHFVHPNCYHMFGPHGVKLATKSIKQALETSKFTHVIRADIKSFYSSISHTKLIQDIGRLFDDPKVLHMLSNIIKNPIETYRGVINPDVGIALRGPLSQLFSAIYLKPLDDRMMRMDVHYARYQDDIVILCKSQRQMNRCRRVLMNILHERRLKLSRKKTKFGAIEQGFHFLGVDYQPT